MPVSKGKTAKKNNVLAMPGIFRHELDMVGLGFRMKRDARDVLAGIVAKKPLTGVKLEREPENKYDLNAIAVYHPDRGPLAKKHLGYLRADTAAIIAPLWDEGLLRFKSATLTALDAEDDWKTGTLDVEFIDKRKKG